MAPPSSPDDRVAYLSALCRAIPYHVVEAGLENPSESALEPEVFEGSALNLDLVGFTPLCERLAVSGPGGHSRLSKLLDSLFEMLEVRAIFPYVGYIVQFAGDAFSVIFRGEGHAQRCVAAALTAQRLMTGEMRERVLGELDADLKARIGIDLGPVRWSMAGDMSRRVALTTGDAIRGAMAMQRRTDPGQVLASPRIVEALGATVTSTPTHHEGVIVTELSEWPERMSIDPLEERLVPDTEIKIGLLEPFVPEPLATRMRTAPTGWRLRGEIRRVVVCFCDVQVVRDPAVDFTVGLDLSRSLLRAFRKYDGVVLKAITTPRGVQVLVLWGLVRPADNDAERAVLAGLEAMSRFRAFASAAKELDSMRVGVHLGDVYLGAVGSGYKHDLTVIGDTVNVAARVSELAGTNEVAATEEVIHSIEGQFKTTRRDPIHLKGREVSVRMHVVHAPAKHVSHYGQQRSARRFNAGRREESRRLDAFVEQALRGEGHVIGVFGNAGTGKSHMLANVIDQWIEAGGKAVVGRCRFATQTIPLAPIIEMFANFFGIAPDDDAAQRADHIRTTIRDYAIRGNTEEFLSLFEPVTRPDGLIESLVDLADIHSRDRVIDTIFQFTDQRVDQGRFLYILEDLHLADTLTLALVRRIMALRRDRSFLMIATYRPQELLRDVRHMIDDEIELKNLDRTDAASLIQHEMRADAVAPELAEFLWRRTEGNPEHLVQIVRFLADRLLLNVKGNTVVPADPGLPLLQDVVPRDWSHVALARLEGLGEIERLLLRTASAIGQSFAREMLEEASGMSRDPDLVETAISSLEARQVIAFDTDTGPSYRFRDDITRAIAYSMIPEEERRDVHARIADALESRSEYPESVAAALAHHRERAGQWVEAARWYQVAARIAARAGLDREAGYFADRWDHVVLQVHQDERPDRTSSASMGIIKLISRARQGRPQETRSLALKLSQLYSKVIDASSANVIDLFLGEALTDLGRTEEARSRLDRIFLNSSEEPGIRCDAAHVIARTYQRAMLGEQAREWIDRARGLVGDDRYRSVRLDALLADLLTDEGLVDNARAILVDALAQAEDMGRARLVAMLRRSLGRRAVLCGTHNQADTHLEEALGLDRRLGDWRGEAHALALLGQNRLHLGGPESARLPLEKALTLAREVGDESSRAAALVHLGAAVGLSEDIEAGIQMVRDGLALAVQCSLKDIEIHAGLYLLRLAIAREDVESIQDHLSRCEANRPLMKVPLFQRQLEDLTNRAQAFL